VATVRSGGRAPRRRLKRGVRLAIAMSNKSLIGEKSFDVNDLHVLLGEIGDLADLFQQVKGVTDKMDDRLERAMGRRLYEISLRVQPYRIQKYDCERNLMKWF
jgi:hypothetical protein